MRVYIGKYKYPLSTYKFGLFLKEKLGLSENTVDSIVSPIQKVLNFIWNDRGEQNQKVKVEIDDYDVWGASSTLAYIIHPVLVKLKEVKHGVPITDFEDAPEYLRPSKEEINSLEEWETDSLLFDRWDWILDEMIYAFKMQNINWEHDFYSGEHDIQFVATEDPNFSEMVRGPKDTFKVDNEGIKEVQDRINNGLRLFGKYYGALWD